MAWAATKDEADGKLFALCKAVFLLQPGRGAAVLVNCGPAAIHGQPLQACEFWLRRTSGLLFRRMNARRAPRWRSTRAAAFALAMLGHTACGNTKAQAREEPPTALTHDFGTIAHGKSAEHDFVLDTRALGDLVALGVSADCSCSRSQMFLRDAHGQERAITGQPFAEFAAKPAEVLVIRMLIDSAQKEPVDIGPVKSKASVILQQVDARDSYHRIQWPLLFQYTIDSPVKVKPYAVLDFGRVPRSAQPTQTTLLQSDLPGKRATFSAPHCDDPRFQFTLKNDGEWAQLVTTFTPKDSLLEPFRTLVTIDTDLPDSYQVKLAAVGAVIDDFEVLPMPAITLRADPQHEQPATQATTQYLLITDHDRRRPPEFQLVKFVDSTGKDVQKYFEVRFEPVIGEERTRRLFLRCLGGLSAREFRGELVLAKDADEGPFLSVAVVAFAQQSP